MNLKFDWLRQFPLEIQALDTIPLLGLPAFPWKKLSESLAQTFECADFEISSQQLTWRTKENLLEGLNPPLSSLVFTIPNLKGEAYWLMTEEEVYLLECLLLTNETNPLTIQDPDFKNSFYRFLILETLYALNRVIPDPALMPVLANQKELPIEESLCVDISIKSNNRYLNGRLVVSQDLRQSLQTYSQKNFPQFSLEKTQNIVVPLSVEIGHTSLSLADWKLVTLGDVITLDHCSIQLDDLVGQVTLSAFGQQAFRGELQGTKIKIIQFPLFQQEDNQMAKNTRDENEDDDELSDLDLSFDEDDDDFDELDEDLFKDFEMDEDEEKSEEFTLSNETPQQGVIEENKSAETLQPSIIEENEAVSIRDEIPPPETEGAQISSEIPTQGLLKPEQVPVSITVELGNIQITMDKLLQMEPGNLLNIAIQPENKVNLTLNGKIIAKAELIRIGESLGVRILDLG